MPDFDFIAFRAAASEVGDRRLGLFKRRKLRSVLDDDHLAALLHAEMSQRFAADDAPADDRQPSDTPILDKFGLWFTWIIEHQDEILALVEKIIAIVLSIAIMEGEPPRKPNPKVPT